MILDDARAVAQRLTHVMVAYAERVAIAGSIRREVSEVKDIEIVAIPKWYDREEAELLGARVERMNLLYEWARTSGITWIKPATPMIQPWHIKPDGKYWRGLVDLGRRGQIKLDLFLCTPQNWGTILLIRTGSADFSHAVATYAQQHGMTLKGLQIAEEAEVFRRLGLQWVDPPARRSGAALRMIPMLRGGSGHETQR